MPKECVYSTHMLPTALLFLLAPGAAAPAPSPPARIAALDKYLLFDVIFHEQLNKQRRALMFFLDLAMKTKRILVLPRARLLRRKGFGQFHPNADYVPWGEVRRLPASQQTPAPPAHAPSNRPSSFSI